MFPVSEINKLIAQYKSQEAVFSSQLNQQTIKLMKAESDFTFLYLELLAQTYANELDLLPDKIKNFFQLREKALRNSNIAYSRHPFLPANQLCLKLAELISKPNEPICQILMPETIGLCRESKSLKSETEPDGHFCLEHYFMTPNGDSIIPLAELFLAAAEDTNCLFPDFQDDDRKRRYKLDRHDLFQLPALTGESSEQFFSALEAYHYSQYDDNSFGFALGKLIQIIGACRNDIKLDLDSFSQAALDKSIKELHDLWHNLPQALIAELKGLVLNESEIYLRKPLGSYLNVLFLSHPECPGTEADLVQLKNDGISFCIKSIRSTLKYFLKQHPKLFEIQVCEKKNATQQEQDLIALKLMAVKAVESLHNRGQVLNGDDDYLCLELTQLIMKVKPEFPNSINLATEIIASQIQRYSQILEFKNSKLQKYPKLFPKVIDALRFRLGKLENIGPSIVELFTALKPEDQQLIIDNRLQELIDYCLKSNAKEFINSLALENRPKFEKLYLLQLAENIKTIDDLCNNLELFSDKNWASKILLAIQSKLPMLCNNRCKFIQISPYFDDKTQILLIDSIPELENWINPSCCRIFDCLEALSKKHLCARIFRNVKQTTQSLHNLMGLLRLWKDSIVVQRYLMTQFDSLYSAQVTDGELLLSCLLVLNSQLRFSMFKSFAHLVTTASLYSKCLVLIPENKRQDFLLSVQFKLFVKSLESLTSLLSGLPPGLDQLIILIGFNQQQLNCSEEAFNHLIKANLCTIVRELGSNFSKIILVMLDPQISDQKKIESLQNFMILPLTSMFSDFKIDGSSDISCFRIIRHYLIELLKNRYEGTLFSYTDLAKFTTDSKMLAQNMELMPKQFRSDFLANVPFKSFISDLSSLKEIVSTVDNYNERMIIFGQFDYRALNCSQEEFNELETCVRDALDQEIAVIIIKNLENYLQGTRPHKIAIALVYKLKIGLVSKKDIINLCEAGLLQITNEYHFINRSFKSHLPAILEDALVLIKSGSNIKGEPQPQSLNIGLGGNSYLSPN